MAKIKKLTAAEQAQALYEEENKIVEKEMAQNLLTRGYPIEKISELTNLTFIEVEKIKNPNFKINRGLRKSPEANVF